MSFKNLLLKRAVGKLQKQLAEKGTPDNETGLKIFKSILEIAKTHKLSKSDIYNVCDLIIEYYDLTDDNGKPIDISKLSEEELKEIINCIDTSELI